jgi:hypothetical protein
MRRWALIAPSYRIYLLQLTNDVTPSQARLTYYLTLGASDWAPLQICFPKRRYYDIAFDDGRSELKVNPSLMRSPAPRAINIHRNELS